MVWTFSSWFYRALSLECWFYSLFNLRFCVICLLRIISSTDIICCILCRFSFLYQFLRRTISYLVICWWVWCNLLTWFFCKLSFRLESFSCFWLFVCVCIQTLGWSYWFFSLFNFDTVFILSIFLNLGRGRLVVTLHFEL